ncbi:MAG: radical SAM protein [Acidilobaceae archaeon]
MRFNGNVVLQDLKIKKELKVKLESSLSEAEIREALLDGHAKRRPRPCGLTIHTSTGCSYGCLYCYIFDMGFSQRPEPYKLSSSQLVYALISNESFVVGRHGTLLAFGSVTEPFMPIAKRKTMEYLKATSSHLGNPQQISVKGVLEPQELEDFTASAETDIDVLISLTTFNKAKQLEPRAPSPTARLDFAMELIKRKVSVALFVRPILPSVTDREFDLILEGAEKRGVKRLVLGTLRLTKLILKRLETSRAIDIEELRSRTPLGFEKSQKQIALRASDIKKRLQAEANSRGFKVYPAACASSIDAHKLYCRLCGMGPCGEKSEAVKVDEEGIKDAAETLRANVAVNVCNDVIDIICLSNWKACDKLKLYIETVAKVRTRVRRQE